MLLVTALAVAVIPTHPTSPLPPRDCAEHCDEVVWFAPSRGLGYEDVALDEEESLPESTTYLRRDLMIAVKYAAAKVYLATGGHPLVLGDASDRNGLTPGAAYGHPRHPLGSHVAGYDIDLGYYQRGTVSNQIQPICDHYIDGVDQWHCIAPPKTLDARRTALFIGFLFESPHMRIIGIDNEAAAPIRAALDHACRTGEIEPDACRRVKLGYETANNGLFWFYGHHNHMHVSWRRD